MPTPTNRPQNRAVLKHFVKNAARIAGVEVYRSTRPTRWSHAVEDYYPVQPQPRWGHGTPTNPHLVAALEADRATYERSLLELEGSRDALHAISPSRYQNDQLIPRWDNEWFTALDAAALVGFILSRKPRRYVEVGSGHSTLFASYAVKVGGLATSITSIDPAPRQEINAICDQVVRKPLEACELTHFDGIGVGDILLFDGSHRVFTNSDACAFFLDVLPRLPAGVLVGVHDVFLPSDYPRSWNRRLYSEQYLLGVMLLCQTRPFRVVLPSYFVCTDAVLGERVRQLFRFPGSPEHDIPFLYDVADAYPGNSFWFETASQPRAA